MAPAMAVPVSEVDKFSDDFKLVRPFGRFWMDIREKGFGIGLVGLRFLGELMLKHLALSMAIVAIVAAIDDDDAAVASLCLRIEL